MTADSDGNWRLLKLPSIPGGIIVILCFYYDELYSPSDELSMGDCFRDNRLVDHLSSRGNISET